MKLPRHLRGLSGRDGPSIVEKEAIFRAVLSRTQPSRAATLRWWFLPAAAASLVAVLVFWHPGSAELEQVPDAFRARGAGTTASLELRCLAPDGGAGCARGGKLVLDFRALPRAYVAAVAVGESGDVVWYTPADGAGTSADPELRRVVALDDSHPSGDYTVHAFFSERPLAREEVRVLLHEAGASVSGITRIQRKLHVVGAAPGTEQP